jgi:hypothetical protein
LWVVVLGHAHAQRGNAQLNLLGADVDADEFAEWFVDFPCRRSVFFLTTALSGRFLEALSAPRRVVVAAAAGDEINGTLFPLAFAAQLESLGQNDGGDADADASISLRDLYLAVVADVSSRYETDELIPTEHALLDDNGDGRGTEIQPNQPSSFASRRRARRDDEPLRPDGVLAASILLNFSSGNPSPP